MLKIAVLGASGRMGRAVVEAIDQAPEMALAAAVAWPGSSHLGVDAATLAGLPAGAVAVTADVAAAMEQADVAIDFALPDAIAAHLDACLAVDRPLVVGTTGLDEPTRTRLAEAAERIAVLHAANMSVGVNLCLGLVELAARVLGDYDVEIIETHHGGKGDAPSGTALELGRRVAAARGQRFEDVARTGSRDGPRAPGTVGFSSIRAGDIVGEHTVLLAAAGERVEITHRAGERGVFARGALKAAQWITSQGPGLYGMAHVLEGARRGL